MPNAAFARALRMLRERKGLSQERFGFEAGLHRTYVSQLERGLKSPSLDTLERIARVLRVSVSQMMKIVESSKKNATRG